MIALDGRKSSEPAPIGELIGEFLKDHGFGATGTHARVLRAWDEALDASLARHARAVRFRAGELTVEVDSASHLQELKSFTGEEMRKRANERIGRTAIRRVVFKLKG